MGGGHGSSRDGGGLAVVPGGGDVETYGRGEMAFGTTISLHTGSPDIYDIAPVGEGNLFVSDVGGTDGGDGGGTPRGVVGSVSVIIPGGNNGSDTRGDEVRGGGVGGSYETAAQAQGSNGRAAAAFGSTSDPVNSGNAVGRMNTGSNAAFPRESDAHVRPGTIPLRCSGQTNGSRRYRKSTHPSSSRTFTAITLADLATPL